MYLKDLPTKKTIYLKTYYSFIFSEKKRQNLPGFKQFKIKYRVILNDCSPSRREN
jgi:hypothetical protein